MGAKSEVVGNVGHGPNSPGEWWRGGTIYQVYPRSFADSNADGIGDIRGVIDKIDYISWLGVDAVWLSPVYRSPQHDNGYDISDYYSIDAAYGSLEDLDELIASLHDRGIRLIMDLVVNHTSNEHPWFIESSSSSENPKRDWYIWRPARPGIPKGTAGAEPTNWESYFSTPAWTFDKTSGEYYLHLFAPEQPDLNWESPTLRREIYRMMTWWLDRGVDGFRMDVINLISKNYPLQDGKLLPHGELGDGSPWYLHGPRLLEFLDEMSSEVFSGRHSNAIRIGETPDVTIEQAEALSAEGASTLDMVFQFEHVGLDREAQDWHKPRDIEEGDVYHNLVRWQEGLASTGWNSLYWSNHDQTRTVSRYGDDRPEHWANSAKTLATTLYLMRGTAFVYQGDEIGMTNFPFSNLDDFRDVSAVNYIAAALGRGESPEEILGRLKRTSRDNARTPMQWAATERGGFSDSKSWYPVNPNFRRISVDQQIGDRASVLAHYKRVIAARKTRPELVEGRFVDLDVQIPGVIAYERIDGSRTTRVVANLSSEPVETTFHERPDWAERGILAVNPAGDDYMKPWQSIVWVS